MGSRGRYDGNGAGLGRLCPFGGQWPRRELYPLPGGRKRIRTAPSDRGPSRRQRARPPLSTGRPDPFPSPTPRPAGAVWQPCLPHRAEKRLAASVPRPGADQITAGLTAPASPPGPGPWAETYRASHRCQAPRNVTRGARSGQVTGHPAAGSRSRPQTGPAGILPPNCYPGRTPSDQAKLHELRGPAGSHPIAGSPRPPRAG